MAVKERNQNPLVGDTVRLKFFIFNGSDFTDPHEIQKVDIYKLYATDATTENPLGRVLLTTVEAVDIVKDGVGKYYIDLELAVPLFTQGNWQDEWHVEFEEDSPVCQSPMAFRILPTVWFTDSMPIVHDFSFEFRPNRIVLGSKKYLQVTVRPDVPRGTDKERYYENMAVAGELYISIEQKCGECLPEELDLRLLVDQEQITERDGCTGYYLLDTTEDSDFDCGIYNVWFEAHLGPNVFISDKQPFQIYH
jgi:hypothetical protein